MSGIVVVGAGPGIGTAVAQAFGRRSMPVGLIARTQTTLDAAAAQLADDEVEDVEGVIADAASEQDLTRALDRLVESHGVPEVLVYNAGLIRHDRPGELSHEQLQHAYAVNVLGALTAAAHLAPAMAAAGGGSILMTGGMPRPVSALVSLSLGKASLRALTTMLADEYGPSGIHVATVVVSGAVAPGSAFDPEVIATHYVRLHAQDRDQWETQIEFTG